MSDLLRDIGARVRSALAPLAGAIVYRTTASFSLKAATAAEIGATTVSLSSLPAGFTGVLTGDTLSLTTPRVFTADTPAVAGVVTNAPIDGPLVARITAGSTVTIRRNVDVPCSGWPEDATQALAVGVNLVTGAMAFNVLADTIATEPKVDGTLVVGGRAWTIRTAALDPTGAVWRLTCA